GDCRHPPRSRRRPEAHALRGDPVRRPGGARRAGTARRRADRAGGPQPGDEQRPLLRGRDAGPAGPGGRAAGRPRQRLRVERPPVRPGAGHPGARGGAALAARGPGQGADAGGPRSPRQGPLLRRPPGQPARAGYALRPLPEHRPARDPGAPRLLAGRRAGGPGGGAAAEGGGDPGAPRRPGRDPGRRPRLLEARGRAGRRRRAMARRRPRPVTGLRRAPAPRIFGIPAARAPIVAVLRRGPTGWSHLGRWAVPRGGYEPGTSVRGNLSPQRCDLSPDGRWFCYFTLKGSARWEVGATYVAISRLPWLTALAAWTTCGTWTRGLHFVGDRKLWQAGPPPPR